MFAKSLEYFFHVLVLSVSKVQWLSKIETFVRDMYMLVFHVGSVLPGLRYCDWTTSEINSHKEIKSQQVNERNCF